tara:strand:- start:1260 stop:1667 length:408 start_codon:yes stop_codon:yes gene_type:complete
MQTLEQRIIKFRGVGGPDGSPKLYYGQLSTDNACTTSYAKTHKHRICWTTKDGGYANIPVKIGTVGQFTGLHDSIGVPIYEGDIVFNDFLKGEVIFEDGSFTTPFSAENEPLSVRAGLMVIGNIFGITAFGGELI